MEQLVVTMDVEPSWGHVQILTKNDVFWYQEIVTPNTRTLDIENFQLQRSIEDSVKYLEKVTSKINGKDHSSTMNFYREHNPRKMILVMLIFIINSMHTSQICTFYKSPTHIVGNCPHKSNQVPIFVIESIFGTT